MAQHSGAKGTERKLGKAHEITALRTLQTSIAHATLASKQTRASSERHGMPTPLQQTVTPYFTVHNADRLIDFLIAAFGANLVKESRYDDGSVQHARLLVGNSLVMLNQSTEDYPVNISQMHICVEDTDASFQSALRLGATPLMAPNNRPHGARMAGVKDPCGNIWWLASEQT